MFHVVSLLDLKIFGGQNELPCKRPSIESPSSLFMFSSVFSISNTISEILIEMSIKLKMGVESFIRKDKRLV